MTEYENLYLFHNKKCSKSRNVKKFLDEKNLIYKIIDYLNEPIDLKILHETIKCLGTKPNNFIRTNEMLFKNVKNDIQLFDEKNLVDLILKYPPLLQRPIVSKEKNNKIIQSLVCRPPELIETFLLNKNC
tara:strand:+ start:256 stop:645 length:390 start_codon:yes stop_codon:yes gene_type:complete